MKKIYNFGHLFLRVSFFCAIVLLILGYFKKCFT